MKITKFNKFKRENPWIKHNFNAGREELNSWIKKLNYIAFRPLNTLSLDVKSSVCFDPDTTVHFSLTPNLKSWNIERYGVWFHLKGLEFASQSITIGFRRKEETVREVLEWLTRNRKKSEIPILDVVVRIIESGNSDMGTFMSLVELFRIPEDFKL